MCELLTRSLLLGLMICWTGAPPGLAADADQRTLEVEGWTVHVDQRLVKDQPQQSDRALELLRDQLRFVKQSVAPRHLPDLQRVPLWVSPKYPGIGPKAEYHPSRQWLVDNGRNPAMARCVEFTNVAIFEKEVQRMPCFVLHELAHAYHDQVLGYDHKGINETYEAARAAGTYEQVKRGDGNIERAYAITNAKEYFAECTEAYFGQNDFYPFNAKELQTHDPAMHQLLQDIWGPVGK